MLWLTMRNYTTEYVTLYTRYRVNRCRYNRIRKKPGALLHSVSQRHDCSNASLLSAPPNGPLPVEGTTLVLAASSVSSTDHLVLAAL
jgi:hypothetical protein